MKVAYWILKERVCTHSLVRIQNEQNLLNTAIVTYIRCISEVKWWVGLGG